MALSLEVKKFINSEHTGAYVQIPLPGDYIAQTEPTAPEPQEAAPQPEQAEGPVEESAAARAARILNEQEEEPAQPDAPAAEIPAASAGTARIHYMDEGSGEPLILIHTVGQSLYTWREVFKRLSEHYRVIALDLLGHGYSDRPEEFDYTVDAHAQTIRLFMDALGIESAHFLAFSMGCAYVSKFVLDNPERVGRLVYIAPGGITEDMPASVKLLDSSIFGGLAAMLYNMKTVRKVLEDGFFDLTFINDDIVQEYYRPLSDRAARRTVRYSLHYFDDSGLMQRLREINCEVLIITGNEDKWRDPASIELIHAALPNAGVAVIRNAGHFLQEEKPERLIAAMLEFIPVMMPEV